MPNDTSIEVIRETVRAGHDAGHVFVILNGQEALIKTRAIGPDWIERATIEDFKRVAVY